MSVVRMETASQPAPENWLDPVENSLVGMLKSLATTRLPQPTLSPEHQKKLDSLFELLKDSGFPFNLDLPSIGLPRPKPEDVFYYDDPYVQGIDHK